MSANLVVDIGATCDYRTSVVVGSGSNEIVGQVVDFLHANTYCNVFVTAAQGSGAIEVKLQTSESTASGTFSDPTSGLVLGNFPTVIQSGGRFFANSGLWVSGNYSETSVVDNAPLFCSGGIAFAAFQRPHRYARLVLNSGPFPNWITAGFVSNKRTIGSGGGFTLSPTSGAVNV